MSRKLSNKFDIAHSSNWRRGSAANAQIRHGNIIPYRKEKGNNIHYGTCHIMKIDAFKRNREMPGVRTIARIGGRETSDFNTSLKSGLYSCDTTRDLNFKHEGQGLWAPTLFLYYLKQIFSNWLHSFEQICNPALQAALTCYLFYAMFPRNRDCDHKEHLWRDKFMFRKSR